MKTLSKTNPNRQIALAVVRKAAEALGPIIVERPPYSALEA